MKFEIRPAKNGIVLKVDHGDEGEEPEEIVYQESDGNEIEAFADFLHFINDHWSLDEPVFAQAHPYHHQAW